jgi:hypothetical protein
MRRHLMKCLFCLIFLILFAPAFAGSADFSQQPVGPPAASSAPSSGEPGVSAAPSRNSSIQLGFTYSDFDYREDLDPPHKSTESGRLKGGYGFYEYSAPSHAYGKLFLGYSDSDVTYDGSTQGGTPLTFSDSRQKIFKFEVNVGYSIPLGKNTSIIPFLGYGYHYWERGQGRITPAFIEYEEDYHWNYIPLGFKIEHALADRLKLGFTAQMNCMYNGKMKVRTSEVGLTGNDGTFELGNRVGFYLELPLRFDLTKWLFINVTPWYQYIRIGESDRLDLVLGNQVVGYAYEPSSRTNWYGINLGVGFSF